MWSGKFWDDGSHWPKWPKADTSRSWFKTHIFKTTWRSCFNWLTKNFGQWFVLRKDMFAISLKGDLHYILMIEKVDILVFLGWNWNWTFDVICAVWLTICNSSSWPRFEKPRPKSKGCFIAVTYLAVWGHTSKGNHSPTLLWQVVLVPWDLSWFGSRFSRRFHTGLGCASDSRIRIARSRKWFHIVVLFYWLS